MQLSIYNVLPRAAAAAAVSWLRFLVISLLFDFFPLNQIDQDIHTKYTLSSDAELILIRSLTLGKVNGESSGDAQAVIFIFAASIWHLLPMLFSHS